MSGSVTSSPSKRSDAGSESQGESQLSDMTNSQPGSKISPIRIENPENAMRRHAELLSEGERLQVINRFIAHKGLSNEDKERCLGMQVGVLFKEEIPSQLTQEYESGSDNEDRTPDDVIELIHDITILNNNLDNIYTKELESGKLNEELTNLNSRLDNILGRDDITSTSLNGVLDPEKIKDPNDEITVISALSKSTTMIMQNETLSKIRSNLSSENTYQKVDRNTNIKNILKSMLQNDMRRQIHMKDGKDDKLRDQVERFLGTDNQFVNVWSGTDSLGSIDDRTKFAKTGCCYLCGGNLVTNQYTSPEMEHKLPSLEFYTKVHNINEKYPELLGLWKEYIDSKQQRIKDLHIFINCNPTTWNITRMDPDPIGKVNRRIKVELELFRDFIEQQGVTQDKFEEFIALLKVHLMEFAYSHHTCNQMKENDNLNTSKLRQNYLSVLATAKEKGSYSSKPLLKESKLHEEESNIPKRPELEKRNLIIGGHMNLINQYIEEYALLFVTEDERKQYRTDKSLKEFSLKKLMVQSIKNTIDYIIKTKNIEKQKKMKQIRDEEDVNNTAEYRQILDVLKDLQINKNIFSKLTRRTITNYFRSEPYTQLINSISENKRIELAVLNGRENFTEMEPETMYNNLVNSSLGNELVSIYKSRRYEDLLNQKIELYFDNARLNDNNTAGDRNEEEVEEEAEAKAKVEDPDSSFESAKESGNEEDIEQMDLANSSDGDSVKSRNSSHMAVSSDDGREPSREPSDAGSEDDEDDEVAKATDTAAADAADAAAAAAAATEEEEEEEYQRSQRPGSKTLPVKSRQRHGSKTPPFNLGVGRQTRSMSVTIPQDQLPQEPQDQRRRSPRFFRTPNSTTNLPTKPKPTKPNFKFGGKRKTNKMRRKQTPKRSMRRKTKNTRSSRKRTHRKTNTNKHTHTRRRR